MTPEQIRKMVDSYTGSLEKLKASDLAPTVNAVNGITNSIMLLALVEIAAQLAELNVRFRETQVDVVMILKDIALHTTGK